MGRTKTKNKSQNSPGSPGAKGKTTPLKNRLGPSKRANIKFDEIGESSVDAIDRSPTSSPRKKGRKLARKTPPPSEGETLNSNQSSSKGFKPSTRSRQRIYRVDLLHNLPTSWKWLSWDAGKNIL